MSHGSLIIDYDLSCSCYPSRLRHRRGCRPRYRAAHSSPHITPQPDREQHPKSHIRGNRGLRGSHCASVEYTIRSLVIMALQSELQNEALHNSRPKLTEWIYKMLVIAFHEFGHAITACCTGGRVKSISLDPHEGGVTHMEGGISAITLPAGYLGSSLIGALLIFCGFDIVASKIASIVLGVCFLLTLWWARKDWLTIGTVLAAVGLLIACWFIDHAYPLRYVVVSDCPFPRTKPD